MRPTMSLSKVAIAVAEVGDAVRALLVGMEGPGAEALLRAAGLLDTAVAALLGKEVSLGGVGVLEAEVTVTAA